MDRHMVKFVADRSKTAIEADPGDAKKKSKKEQKLEDYDGNEWDD